MRWFLQPAVLVVILFGHTVFTFTSIQCEWACTHARNAKEASICPKCAESPPIDIYMCRHACGHRDTSAHLATICNKCFDNDKYLMKIVCRVACKNTYYQPNISVCSACIARKKTGTLQF